MEAESREAQHDGLRVQVAAIAAQQSALLLDEERLSQRTAALERRESQLAAHFDGRRQQLLRLQERLRAERQALQANQAALTAEREEMAARTQQERAEAVAAGEAARKERTRLVALRKRLKQRWRKHWLAHESALAAREKQLAVWRAEVADDAAALQSERAALLQAQLRFNGEAEVARRQLREGWEELALKQQEWEKTLNWENAERGRRTREFEARAAALTASERALREREKHASQRQLELAREVAGLEIRAQNQRAKLAAMGPIDPPTIPPARTDAADPPVADSTPQFLGRLMDELADQRLHLLDQWIQVLSVRDLWQIEHQASLSELEAAAGRLGERERALIQQESDSAARVAALEQQRQRLLREQSAIDGLRSSLALRESACASEAACLRSEAEQRQAHATGVVRRMGEIRSRWSVRRRAEYAQLQADRARCDEVRSAYVALLRDWHEQRTALEHRERDLAIRQTALDRLGSTILNRAPDAVAAERRLTKLQSRIRAAFAREEDANAAARLAAQAELTRLMEEWQRISGVEEKVRRSLEDWEKQQMASEAAMADADVERARQSTEIQVLRASHQADQRHIDALRDEVERIARNLIDDGEDRLPPAERRAA
jgi:hypothetical protein